MCVFKRGSCFAYGSRCIYVYDTKHVERYPGNWKTIFIARTIDDELYDVERVTIERGYYDEYTTIDMH